MTNSDEGHLLSIMANDKLVSFGFYYCLFGTSNQPYPTTSDIWIQHLILPHPLYICPLHSMSTTATYYTKLYLKHGDLTGSPNQAYNLLPTKYFDHILGGIGAGTIAALGTVAPGSYNLSYMYAPQVHTDLGGNFLGFCGNACNRIGEFSCIHIHKDSFDFFQIIDSKANLDKAMPGHSSNVTPFTLDLLSKTDWANLSET
jgi:hypothetical protein